MIRKRVIIEFWAERLNCIKRSRVTVRLNQNDVLVWTVPKKYVSLFNSTAVYIYYKKDWLIAGILDKNREVCFLYCAPWEFERDYFTGKLDYASMGKMKMRKG